MEVTLITKREVKRLFDFLLFCNRLCRRPAERRGYHSIQLCFLVLQIRINSLWADYLVLFGNLKHLSAAEVTSQTDWSFFGFVKVCPLSDTELIT